MPTEPGGPPPGTSRARFWVVRRWQLFEMPARLVTSIALVETAAVGLVGTVGVRQPLPDVPQLWLAAVLLGLALAHTELSIGVERVRRRVGTGNHVDLSSVWTFAAALVLPAIAAVAVAVVVQGHIWARTARPRVPPYRIAFTTATIVLAVLGASGVITFVGGGETPSLVRAGVLGAVLALAVYSTVNGALVAGAVAMSVPQPDVVRVLGRWDDNLLEIATLSLGALTAAALVVNPWLVLLSLPPLLVLHRAVLVRHLEEAANIDGKTGLLNAAAWHAQAEQALRRSGAADGPRGVLVLDLDHFKAVNDTHGHLAGDQVLAAVASALRTEVRDRDLVGRFGGEEFVVLLGGPVGGGAAELEAVAERVRRRVAGLTLEIPTPDGPLTVSGLSVSIGVAVAPAEGADLRTLLQVADTALYAAKRAGRNVVRVGTPPPAHSAPGRQGGEAAPGGGWMVDGE